MSCVHDSLKVEVVLSESDDETEGWVVSSTKESCAICGKVFPVETRELMRWLNRIPYYGMPPPLVMASTGSVGVKTKNEQT